MIFASPLFLSRSRNYSLVVCPGTTRRGSRERRGGTPKKLSCGAQFLVLRKSDKVTVSQHLGAMKTFGLYDLILLQSCHHTVTKSSIAGILIAQNFAEDSRTPICDYFSISEDQKIGPENTFPAPPPLTFHPRNYSLGYAPT